MNPATTGALAPADARTLPEYSPTTYVDFSQPQHRAAFEKALDEVRAGFGREYPLVIGGERIQGGKTFASTNPAKPSEVLGTFQSGAPSRRGRRSRRRTARSRAGRASRPPSAPRT